MILNQRTKLTNPTKGILRTLSVVALTAMTLPFTALTFAQNDAQATLQERKLNEIIVPKIEFKDTPFRKAMNFMVQRSRELDTISADPAKKGINIACIGAFEDALLDLDLSDIPLGKAIELSAMLIDGKIEKRSNVIVIRSGKNSGENPAINSGEADSKTNLKLDEIVIPNLDLSKTPLKEVLAFLRQHSVELDQKSPANKKGINIVLKPVSGEEPPTVTLRLTNVTLRDALSLVAESAGFQMQITGDYVLIGKPVGK